MTQSTKVCPNCGAQNPSLRSTCQSCGTWLRGATVLEGSEPPIVEGSKPAMSGVPVRLEVEYPEHLSRLLLFVKWLFAIPLYIALVFYGIGAFIVTFVAFWVILVTGRYPEGMFNFVKGYMAWSFKIYAYFPLLICDHWFPDAMHPLKYEADHPKSL